MLTRVPKSERDDVIAKLDTGVSLVLAIHTNLPVRLVRSSLAKRLVFSGVAEYLPDPERDGFMLETHIRKRRS